MNRILYKQKAHDILRDKHHLYIYLVFFAITVICAVPTAILTNVFKDNALVESICSWVDSLVGVFLLPAVSVVMYNYFVHLARGETITLKEAFHNALPDAKAYGRLVVSHLAYCAIVVIGFVFLILPGILALVYLMFAMYRRAMNPTLPILEDLRQSYDLVRGRWTEMAYFALSFFGWLVLVAITAGIASIWVSPYYMLCKAMMMDERDRELHPEDAPHEERYTDESRAEGAPPADASEIFGYDAPSAVDTENGQSHADTNDILRDNDPFCE